MKSKILTLLFALVLTLPAATQPGFLAQYRANYFVSATGNDANSGKTPWNAWQTITKVNATTFQPGDVVAFRRGDAFYGTLTPANSGTTGKPIIYTAYGTGAKPKIYGSQPVTGWTVHQSSTYKATFADTITQVFVNDVKMQVARLTYFVPGITGYTAITAPLTPYNALKVLTDIPVQAQNYYKGATAITRTENWMSTTRKVVYSNVDTLQFDSIPPDGQTYKAGQGVLLMNKLAFIDSPNEWYSDTATVYLFSPGGDTPANYAVRASNLKYGVNINNKDFITVKNLDFRHQMHSAINITGTNPNDIIIDNCNISGQDNFGVYAYPGTGINFQITNNTISDIAGVGIFGINVGAAQIRNNFINNIGLFGTWGIAQNNNHRIPENHGSGIELSRYDATGRNTIEYNNITNVGYNGIMWRYPADIRYNYIYNSGIAKADGGAIYTGNADASGSNIAYNIIDLCVGEKLGALQSVNMAFGIYGDEGSGGLIIENNTVTRATGAGIFSHLGYGNNINNNKLFDNVTGFLIKGGNLSTPNTFANNFIASGANGQILMGKGPGYKSQTVYATVTNNKYINAFNASNASVFWNQPTGGSVTYYDYAGFNTVTGYNAASTLSTTALVTDETQRIIYNNTPYTKTFYLNNAASVKDSANVAITANFNLAPFQSKYVRGINPQFILPYVDTNTGTLTAGLIAAYDFEEITGLLQDLSGNALHATTHGANISINQTGNPGKAFTHFGTTTSDARITVADNNLLTFTDSLSIFFWVNLTSVNKDHAIIYKGSTNNSEYKIIITSANKVQFNIYQAGTGTTIQVTGSTVLSAGTNYFIECSTADILSRAAMKIFVNNTAETLTPGITSTITSVINGTGNLSIGGETFVGTWLNGKLSQILMYGRLLSTVEKQTLYNAGLGKTKSTW